MRKGAVKRVKEEKSDFQKRVLSTLFLCIIYESKSVWVGVIGFMTLLCHFLPVFVGRKEGISLLGSGFNLGHTETVGQW